MKSTFNVLFYIRKNEVRKDKKCGIMIRITVNGEIKQFSSKLDVDPDQWIIQSGKVAGKSQEAILTNKALDGIKAAIISHYRILCQKFDRVTASQVRDAFLGIQDTGRTLLHFINKVLEQQKSLIGIDIVQYTYDRYERMKTKLEAFLKHKYEVKDIPIKGVNHEFIREFEVYLKQNGCAHNMASKYIQIFKKAIDYAISNRDLDFDPFANYKISFKETEREFLNQTEIEALIQKEFSSARLEEVRDVFIFCCFTGLAYIDTFNLTEKNIQSFYEDEQWVSTKRQKTKNASDIPLLGIPKMILEKYRGKLKNGRLLPVKTNQKMNEYLKEIAVLCGIHKNLTTHCARHTFATTITLSKGVPLESISRMLGHKNLKTTQIYAKITKHKIEEDMQLLRNREPMIKMNQMFEKVM